MNFCFSVSILFLGYYTLSHALKKHGRYRYLLKLHAFYPKILSRQTILQIWWSYGPLSLVLIFIVIFLWKLSHSWSFYPTDIFLKRFWVNKALFQNLEPLCRTGGSVYVAHLKWAFLKDLWVRKCENEIIVTSIILRGLPMIKLK